MPDVIRSNHRTPGALALVLVGLLVAACGGTSTRSTRSATASASASPATVAGGSSASTTGAASGSGTRSSTTRRSSTSRPPGGSRKGPLGGVAPGARTATLRECLAKSGITLALRTRGSGRAGGLLGPEGALQLPKGTSRAKYEAALKSCGRRVVGRRLSRFALSPKAKQALDSFAACMRHQGVNLPMPDTSGKRPIFNTSRLNVAGSKFKAAESRCAPSLRGAFGPRRGPGGGTLRGGAPRTGSPAVR